MSTQSKSLRDELASYNEHLDGCLRSRWHMSLQTFKIIKSLTQLVGAASGTYAMYLGADPILAFALIAFIVTGPEGLEYMINEHGGSSNS